MKFKKSIILRNLVAVQTLKFFCIFVRKHLSETLKIAIIKSCLDLFKIEVSSEEYLQCIFLSGFTLGFRFFKKILMSFNDLGVF